MASGSSFAYTYDPAGNRTGVIVDGSSTASFSYDATDQVVGWTYDGAGNLTNDGATSYSYNVLNHLTGTTAGTQATNYAYNGDGTLVGQTANGTTTYTQDLAAYQSQVLAATSGLTGTDYLYGQDLAPLAALSGTSRIWDGLDGQGSVLQSLDDTGTVLGVRNFDPFSQVEAGSALTGPFGYTGELQDATTGQEYLRVRWHQPGSGTLVSVDPVVAATMESPVWSMSSAILSLAYHYQGQALLDHLVEELKSTQVWQQQLVESLERSIEQGRVEERRGLLRPRCRATVWRYPAQPGDADCCRRCRDPGHSVRSGARGVKRG